MADHATVSKQLLLRLLAELDKLVKEVSDDGIERRMSIATRPIEQTSDAIARVDSEFSEKEFSEKELNEKDLSDRECSDAKLADSAIEIYRRRRRRERKLDADLLGEPCWDILLDLFVNTVRNKPVTVTGACLASNSPTTTALRWLAILEQRGMLKRSPDPFDRRVVLIRLTNLGVEKMRAILSE